MQFVSIYINPIVNGASDHGVEVKNTPLDHKVAS